MGHIRKPLKKVGKPGYRNPGNVDRYNGTVCGAEPTHQDIAWGDRNRKAALQNICQACQSKAVTC